MALVGSGGVGLGKPGKVAAPNPVRAAKPSTKLFGVKSGSGMSLQGGNKLTIAPKPIKAILPVPKVPKGFPQQGVGPSGGVGLVPGVQPATTAAPGGTAGTPPTTSTTTTEPSPYDSTYYIDLARATAAANSRIAGYQTDIQQGQLATQNAIKQLQTNQGLATTNAQNTENSRGGFAQGALGTTIGQIGQNSLNAQSADSLKYQNDSQNWNTAITGVQQGLSVEQIALGLASAARQAALNVKSDGTIGDTTSTTTTPGTAGTAAAGTALPKGSIAMAPAKGGSSMTANQRLFSTPIRGGFEQGTKTEVKNPTKLATSGGGRVIPKAPAKKGK